MDAVSIDRIAGQIEAEIARLKKARPEMTERIEKAESLLVTQLSVSNGVRPIRVTIHADGSRSYTVKSGSRFSTIYQVDPESWSDNCPATKTCKHVIGCYILERVLFAKTAPCSGCNERHPVREMVEITDDEHLSWFAGENICQGCADKTGVV